jgi:hypothetical protein
MNKKNHTEKCLAIGIILLFVGVTIAPIINFNTVKASMDDDLVEVTTQACGIKGYGDTAVKLTREQYQDLEQYLDDFDTRVKQTTTKEEVIVLYKEAIIELNDYGLLPKGMSISLAERLVIGNNLYDKLSGFFKRLPMSDYNIENMKCFVYAEANGLVIPLCVGILLLMSSVIVNKLLDQGRYSLLLFLFVSFYLPILYPIFVVGALFSTLNPINILSDVWLSQGENYKLTAVRYNPYKITEGDLNNHEYDLFGYTGLKLITPDIIYFFGRTLFVVQD